MAVVPSHVIHHAALKRVVTFHYRITCETGLHIGAGASIDLAGSNLPVVRNASGTPFIPGSSLRGVLRTGVESVCRSLSLDNARTESTELEDGLPKGLTAFWDQLTLEERLFGMVPSSASDRGGNAYGSRLQISDARCLTEDVAVELRDGVAISRETRTAAASRGGKYDLELVPAGTAFEGKIRFKNPADYELGLLAQALMMLDQGMLLLGGKSARGLGWVKVAVTRPVDVTAEAMLDGLASPSDDEVAFVDVSDGLDRYLPELRALASEAKARRAQAGEGGD